MPEWGEIAYEGYRDHARGHSLVSGAPLPERDKMPAEIQEAWQAAARAVRYSCSNLLTHEAHGGDGTKG